MRKCAAMTRPLHLLRKLLWATAAATSSLALAACDLGYQGLEPLVDPGNPAGSCAEPAPATITGVEVSRGSDSASPPDGGVGFAALSDGDDVPLVMGLQGADMVVLVLRVNGLDADRCLPQQTTVVNASGGVVARLVRPIFFRAGAPGMAESRSLYLPGEFVRGPHTVTIRIGGATLTRRINVR